MNFLIGCCESNYTDESSLSYLEKLTNMTPGVYFFFR